MYKPNIHRYYSPACLGADHHKYICNDCQLIIYTDVGLDKGYSNEILICPVCSSKNKEPTSKLNQKELEMKKQEIKDRLIKYY